MKIGFLLFSLLLFFAGGAYCQSVQAKLTGTVTDPSGSVVQGAIVTAVEVSQQATRAAVTNQDGNFSIPELKPGTYRIQVQASGFKSEVRNDVELQVEQTERIDFRLSIGDVTQAIEVNGAGVALNTDDSVVGQVISNRAVVELPLNGRNYLELAQLTVGVAPASGSRTQDSGGFSALGQHGFQTRVVLDGVDNSSSSSGGQIGREAQAVKPSVDAVQEFKVVTNNNSAEYGMRMGGTVIVSTKAGTNQFHGSLFEFFRNDKLDAANYFAVGQPKPPYRQNEFGGTVGGPILKNKTFFFLAYDQTSIRQSQATISTVPSAAALGGDFSGLSAIYDPLTTTTNAKGKVVRQAFAGNRIPASRIDPISASVAQLYPAANLPGVASNYYYGASYADDPHEIDSRADHIFNEKNRGFVRYSRRWEDTLTPGALPLPADGAGWTTLSLQSDSLAGDFNTTLTPSINNDFRLGYSLLNTDLGIPETANLNSTYGIKGLNDYGEYNQTGLAIFNVNGFASLGSKSSNPNRNNMNIYQLSDDLSMVRGPHTIKFGFGAMREGIFRRTGKSSRGQFTFDGSYTNNPSVSGTTGAALADFLLGDAQKAQVSNVAGETIVTHNYSAYVQDDWRITSNLTLNLGLRWDLFGPPSYGNSTVNIFQFTPGTQNYNILYPKNGSDCGCDQTWTNFAPRTGFAYQARPGTVIRSGFGIFFGMPDGIQDTSGRFYNQSPSYNAVTLSGDKALNPAATVSGGLPGDAVAAAGVPKNVSVNVAYRYVPTQYSLEWFFDLQQQIAKNSVLTLSYLGSGTRHISQPLNLNQPNPGAGTIASRSPYPYFNQISLTDAVANANYNAFTAKFEQRYSHGLSLLASYTWSHAIDNAEENLNSATGQDPENNYDLRNQRSNSNFDLRHRFVTSLVYDLPFGRGRRFLNRGGWSNAVLGGWQAAGIVNLYTGLAFAPIISTDLTNTGTTNRPNRIGNGTLSSGQRSIYEWFDLSAFTIPGTYVYGNSGRNILTGPSTKNFDLSLGKNFQFSERWRLQFRAEFFNAFNTPNLDLPNPNVDLPQGGQITSAKSSRDIQLGLKLHF